MVPAEVQEQYREMKVVAFPAGRCAMGTLAAKKSNSFPSLEFASIANPMQKKDISDARFGI